MSVFSWYLDDVYNKIHDTFFNSMYCREKNPDNDLSIALEYVWNILRRKYTLKFQFSDSYMI